MTVRLDWYRAEAETTRGESAVVKEWQWFNKCSIFLLKYLFRCGLDPVTASSDWITFT